MIFHKFRPLPALAMLVALAGFSTPQNEAMAFEGHPGEATATPRPADTAIPALMYGKLAFFPCSLSSPMARESLEAQCTDFEVPEDREQADGRKISLHIAWLEATERGDVAPDPVFFLAGGPGQSAVESYPPLDPAFREVRKHRHVILVDQRGTGKSNLLSCAMDEDDDEDSSPEAMRAAAERCAKALSEKADLRHYTTTDAIADLDAVRKSVGAAKINLVGVSYGTRVAQQYAMRHPESTRSIVLDSVVPNTLGLGNIVGNRAAQIP